MKVQAVELEDRKYGFYNHRRRVLGEVFEISDQPMNPLTARKTAEMKAEVHGYEKSEKEEHVKKLVKELLSMPADFSRTWMVQVSEDTPCGRPAPGAALPDHIKPVDPYVASEEPVNVVKPSELPIGEKA